MSQLNSSCSISGNIKDIGNVFDPIQRGVTETKITIIDKASLPNKYDLYSHLNILPSRTSPPRSIFAVPKDYHPNVDIEADSYRRVFTAAASAKGREFIVPDQVSQTNSLSTIRFLSQINLTPTFINPIPEGGIMVEYYSHDNSYLLFEFFDDEEIVFFQRINGERTIMSFNAISELNKNLRRFIDNGRV